MIFAEIGGFQGGDMFFAIFQFLFLLVVIVMVSIMIRRVKARTTQLDRVEQKLDKLLDERDKK